MKWPHKIIVFIFIFFLISCATSTPDIRIKNSEFSMEITKRAIAVSSAVPSPDGRFLLSGNYSNKSISLWNISTGELINKFGEIGGTLGGQKEPVPPFFLPNGKYAFGLTPNNIDFKLWDISTGKEVKEIKGERHIFGNKPISSIALSPDGNYFLASNWQNDMKLYDMVSGKELKSFNAHTSLGAPVEVDYSPNGKYAVSTSYYANIRLWEIATGEEIRMMKSSESYRPYAVKFSPDSRYILTGGMGTLIGTKQDRRLILWDVLSGKEIRSFKSDSKSTPSFANSIAFSLDGKYVVSGAVDATLSLWNVSTGEELKNIGAHREGFTNLTQYRGVLYAAFSPDGKHILSAGDASIRVWDASSLSEIVMMVEFEDGEWLVITSEGYYNSSQKGAQYLKVKFEGMDYTVDQFYDVFYRPDIVAAKLSGEDISRLVSITMKDAIKTPPPLVEFTSHTPGNDQQKAKVCYQIKSVGGGIGEVRLFHNGKLIQSDGYYREVEKSAVEKPRLIYLDSKAIYKDMRSVFIKGKVDSGIVSSKSKGDIFEDCKEIDAIPGENEVSVSAFNGNNTVQGYMKTINFKSVVKPEDPHLYILSIGIDQYTDSNVNLKYAVKDAKNLEERIKTQSATLYKSQNIHYSLLTDREATKTNIVNKINELSNTIKPQDSFILFVAGHGVLLQNQYYMLTNDFNGEVSDTNMISSNEIVEMSKKIKSLSQLFIFDTCHAGGVDTIVSGLYDARMSVLAKKMGLHIYASANDKQAAMDGYKGNGLFTYTLLDGLNNNKEADKYKDGNVSIVGLGEYSKKMTTKISNEIGQNQTPLIINFGKDSLIYKLQ